ncbi:MAG: hypothetical protein JWN16_1565 [Alphaproteobacteria bacterium]|nr:hypothetical protein [Alphaproteobacteria bacterium]
MKTLRLMIGTAVAVASLAVAGSANAAPAGVKIGTLTCNVASGMGFVFGSSKDLRCSYEPTKAMVEHYRGTISKWGVDIGYTGKGKLVWAVFAPTSDVNPGALEGEYAGATAQVNIAVGLGANVLVGGLDKSIALQPLSVEGSTGLNVAAGIGQISLTHVHM